MYDFTVRTNLGVTTIQCRLLHEKLKPHRKNGQITANNKHFTVENVCPPYPPTKRTCGWSRVLQKLKLFPPKKQPLFICHIHWIFWFKEYTSFWFTNGELLLKDWISDNKVLYQCHSLCFTLIVTLLPIIWCDMSGKFTKRRAYRKSDFLHLYFEFRDKKYILSDRAWVDLGPLSIFPRVFLVYGYKIIEKLQNPSDNLDPPVCVCFIYLRLGWRRMSSYRTMCICMFY